MKFEGGLTEEDVIGDVLVHRKYYPPYPSHHIEMAVSKGRCLPLFRVQEEVRKLLQLEEITHEDVRQAFRGIL